VKVLGFMMCSALQLWGAESINNGKSGIMLSLAGSQGTDWEVENLYYDRGRIGTCIIYIKAGTDITYGHNSLNRAGRADGSDNYETVDTSVGVIKYRVDGDQHWEKYVYDWPVWVNGTDFNGLDYGLYGAGGTGVVGTTGSNGVALDSLASKETHFYRGMIDSFGDEWHTLTMADDDIGYTSNPEYRASDGKVWLFVVNPKTPCLSITEDGGQFYTTPPKKYFIPKIYDQTTYFSGTVDFALRDINGNNVFYRIVGNTGDGDAYTDSGGSSVTLDETDFADGPQYLQYYYAGQIANTKTRKIVENPAFPSAGEAHGDRLWVNASYWTSDIATGLSSDSIKSFWLNRWKENAGTGAKYGNGYRSVGGGDEQALVARYHGMNHINPGGNDEAISVSKSQMLDTVCILDPVSIETNTEGKANPTREMVYRGYYDIKPIISSLIAYDIIAGYYRSDQGYADGLTPIEDLFIRDAFAKFVHASLLDVAGYAGLLRDAENFGEMWDTAHRVGAAMAGCMMPSYSTEYYGTSGLDGTATTWPDNPFVSDEYTWSEIFLENGVGSISGFPNLHKRFGFGDADEYLFTDNGEWGDRRSYTATNLMGHAIYTYRNLLTLFNPDRTMANMDAAMVAASTGQLYGLKISKPDDANPHFRSWIGFQNLWYPDFEDEAEERMAARSSGDEESKGKQYERGGVLAILWHLHDIPRPSGSTVSTLSQPTFSPVAGTYEAAQNVSITIANADTIYFTTDGSTPTTGSSVYSSAISVSSSQTLKAFGVAAGYADGNVGSSLYAIGISNPVASPSGGVYGLPQYVALSVGTAGASIYYTTDGSTPDNLDTLYDSPIAISSDTGLNFIAIKAGLADSSVVEESYAFAEYTANNDGWQSFPITNQTSEFAITFEATPDNSPIEGFIGLGDISTVTTYSENAALIRFFTDGTIEAFDSAGVGNPNNGGAWYYKDSTLNYLADTRYDFRLVVDPVAGTYDVFVTPEGGSESLVVDDYAFRDAATNIDTISFFCLSDDAIVINNLSLGTPGAATLALSNPVLSEDGLTIVADIVGGNGFYTPGTGITGLTVSHGGIAASISSATIAGTRLTITLGDAVNGGVWIDMDLSSGSNIRDGNNDTPTNQNDLLIKNESEANVGYFRNNLAL